jgi:hypothetical protein
MEKDDIRLRIPNPHQREISKELLLNLLKEADISRDTWKNL